MTKEQYAKVERLSSELNKVLKAAFEQGDPAGELAQKARFKTDSTIWLFALRPIQLTFCNIHF